MVTFGIYSLVWFVKTKNEINLVAISKIPTAWLFIVPIVSIWWEWKFAVGVEEATDGGLGKHVAFWLLVLLGGIGAAIVQNALNQALEMSPHRAMPVRETLAV